MKVSYNWLKSITDFDASPEEIADILTKQCFELEDLTHVQRYVKGVVVGKVVECEKHPDADKLQVTKVDIGSGDLLNIVCGAPNCRKDLSVVVAPIGTQIGDFKIERRKLRGVYSEGMILSEAEMNISEDHGGILELPESMTLGTRFETMIGPEDTILDFEITVNRPDGLSHIGFAREIAAKFGTEFRMPELSVNEIDTRVSDFVSVDILDKVKCPRYVARMTRDVKVGPSPLWLKALLHSLGQRPINNIVDITNYVMLELGQPLHAFDYHLVSDGKVIIRTAEKGEEFITLDNQKRKLIEKDLLIADANHAIGIAGVMGGLNSEIEDDTEDVLIEAAYFEPVGVRRTSKRLGLSTEASKRFERGADPEMPPIAAQRTAHLIEKYAGGTVLAGSVDAYPYIIKTEKVSVRVSKANKVLGLDISKDEVKSTLANLTLGITEIDEDTLEASIPSFRMHDLEREIDLIEEIARIHGYNKIPTASSSRVVLNSPGMPLEDLVDAAVDTLASLGMRENVNTAMVSDKDQSSFNGGLDYRIIDRPINPEMNSYRASLLPGLLRSTQRNINNGAKNLKMFEVGQLGGKGWLGKSCDQRIHIAFVVTGDALLKQFDRSAQGYDLYDLKGDIDALITGLSLDKSVAFSYDICSNLIEGFSLSYFENDIVGRGGRLHQDVAEAFDIDQDVFVFEADLQRLSPDASSGIKKPGSPFGYRVFSRMPTYERDLAFMVEGNISAGKLEEIIRSKGGEYLETVTLFDLFEGKEMGENKRSLAYHLVFRAGDRTLTDEEISPYLSEVISNCESIDGVTLRS